MNDVAVVIPNVSCSTKTSAIRLDVIVIDNTRQETCPRHIFGLVFNFIMEAHLRSAKHATALKLGSVWIYMLTACPDASPNSLVDFTCSMLFILQSAKPTSRGTRPKWQLPVSQGVHSTTPVTSYNSRNNRWTDFHECWWEVVKGLVWDDWWMYPFAWPSFRRIFVADRESNFYHQPSSMWIKSFPLSKSVGYMEESSTSLWNILWAKPTGTLSLIRNFLRLDFLAWCFVAFVQQIEADFPSKNGRRWCGIRSEVNAHTKSKRCRWFCLGIKGSLHVYRSEWI